MHQRRLHGFMLRIIIRVLLMSADKHNKCRKCGLELSFDRDPFLPSVCACGHMQIYPFEVDGLEFHKLLASSPLFYLFRGMYPDKNLFVDITVLRKDVPDYDWCLKVAHEQAEQLAKLKHLNILPIFDFSERQGYFCVTAPTLDGHPLSTYNPAEHGLMELSSLTDLLQAAALGMAVAHYHEIVHHNIWPSNIHVDARGNIRVKNFFISRFVYIYDQKRIKRDNYIYTSVSPLYISPEKVESGLEDERGDVFSFGVMFYHFLTGRFPFQGQEKNDIIYSRAKLKYKARRGQLKATYPVSEHDFPDYAPPDSPKKLRPEIPLGISELVMHMLSYYPNGRPAFSRVISEFNLLRAKADALNIRKKQEAIIDSDTKTIPKMKSLFTGQISEK